TTLAQLAASDTNPHVRAQAVLTLGSAGALTEPVITTLIQLATSDTNPYVRVQAGAGLGSARALTEPGSPTRVELAPSDAYWGTRRAAVRVLGQAPPAQSLRNVLVSLFKDHNNYVRREVGRVLVEFSRQHPDCAVDIASELAGACSDPAMN